MSQWVADGSLKPKVTEFHGLEEAPQAFVELLAGRTVGTTVVTV
jgi:NADPH-dependent curcumin reductase CurA